MGVEINRIVLQTLTFTSGASGLTPVNRSSILLSDSRPGVYFMNKTRSLIFTTALSPLIFLFPPKVYFRKFYVICI